MTAGHSSITPSELIKQLESKDPETVIKALNKLEKAANSKDLPSIIGVMAGISEQKLLNEFCSFLSKVRSAQAPSVMVECIGDPAYAKIRLELVRACWETNLDYSPHLLLFARLFIAGDYLMALEAFTVIENTVLERPVSKKLLHETAALIKNSLPDQPEAKQRLTQELIRILEPFVSED